MRDMASSLGLLACGAYIDRSQPLGRFSGVVADLWLGRNSELSQRLLFLGGFATSVGGMLLQVSLMQSTLSEHTKAATTELGFLIVPSIHLIFFFHNLVKWHPVIHSHELL